ncbi:MAG: efflux RND transporter permease subunit [Gemmatimonadetes bacterium]|nr:efflux RND transporter permease subunit [Gemmatimonadota bacterium]
MRWLIATALRQRVAVVAVTALLLILGLWTVGDAPLDVFPEFAPPQVEIQTEAPGLSTEEVEALVSVPIENALNGTPYVATVRSKSVLGLSSVVLLFESGTDLFIARQFVAERLARVAPQLPGVARPPVMLSPHSSLARVLKVGLTSDSLSLTELSMLARWTIRPRLMAVPGVANVAIWGERPRQLQVLVDPDRLRAHGVSLQAVEQAAGEAVALQAGGFVDTPQQRMGMAQRAGGVDAAALAAAPIPRPGYSILTLGDVAEVVEGNPPLIGDAVINSRDGLLLIVEKQPWGNTLDVTRGVDRALEALAPALGGVTVDAAIFRPATFIEMALANLNRALLIGCVLVVLVLVLFLRDWRTALISLTAIPLSLVAAAVAMRYRGGTLDTMVLAGLVIALGEVVDDAIIDVENIVRRLRVNRTLASPRSALVVVLEASLEVRSAVVYASVIVALMFLPVFFLGGLAGSFFRPLAQAYVLAIFFSLLTALVVTPALSLLLLPGAVDQHGESPFSQRIKRWYGTVLPRLLDQPRRVSVALGAAFLATLVIVPLLGQEFLPKFKEYDFLMHWVEKPGTSLEAMKRVTQLASEDLMAIPGVRNFGAHIGRAEVADEVVGPNFTELWISIDPDVPYDATVAQAQHTVDQYPGLYRDLLTYLRERVKEVLTGASASIVVRVYGDDLDSLRAVTARAGKAVGGVNGLIDLKVQPLVLVPQIEVEVRPRALAQHGMSAGDVRRQVATLVRGTKVGEVYDRQKIYDVAVWGVPEIRGDPGAIRQLVLSTPGGGAIPLRDVADVRVVPTPNEIAREGSSRRLDVTANVAGRDLAEATRAVEAAVAQVQMPVGFHAEVLGEWAAQRDASRRLLLLGIVALAGIVLVLYADFGSMRTTTIVVASLPLALIGGVAAAALAGGVLSLGSLVGFVTVIGIAARNGIMLVSHFRHLADEEGEPFGRALVIRGATERLVPILMTASVTALALLPLVVGGNQPGHEIEYPMAVVILGGLVSSTLLNLFVMPGLYLRFGARAQATAD